MRCAMVTRSSCGNNIDSMAHCVSHRNGLTGEVVGGTGPVGLPLQYQPRRVRRTRLQSALKAEVKPGVIQLDKKLVSLQDLGDEDGVKLTFEDGSVVIADLVVGADGIRSVGTTLPSWAPRKSSLLLMFGVRRS